MINPILQVRQAWASAGAAELWGKDSGSTSRLHASLRKGMLRTLERRLVRGQGGKVHMRRETFVGREP